MPLNPAQKAKKKLWNTEHQCKPKWSMRMRRATTRGPRTYMILHAEATHFQVFLKNSAIRYNPQGERTSTSTSLRDARHITGGCAMRYTLHSTWPSLTLPGPGAGMKNIAQRTPACGRILREARTGISAREYSRPENIARRTGISFACPPAELARDIRHCPLLFLD